MNSRITLLSFVLILLVLPRNVYSAELFHNSSNFTGTFVNTSISEGSIVLDADNVTGTYTSPVLRIGDPFVQINYLNISWHVESYGRNLPDNGGTNSIANMSENILLLHMDDNYWDGTADEAIDSSGEGNHMTATGSANTTTYEYKYGNHSGNFTNDGSDYLQRSAILGANHSFTILAWVYKTNTDAYDTVFTEPSDFFFSSTSADEPFIQVWNSSGGAKAYIGAAGSFPTDVWLMVGIAINFTEGKAYIIMNDTKTEALTNLDTEGISNVASFFRVGTYSSSTTDFEGYIDEVAVWNRTLTDEELADLYTRGMANLTFQLRTDEDNSSWGNFIGPDGTSNTYYTNGTLETLNLTDNPYLQYRAYFETEDAITTPKLHNLTVGYSDNHTWYSVDFRYRRNIDITEENGYNRTNEPLYFWYDHNLDNFNCTNQTRVTGADRITEVPFEVIENTSTSCYIRTPVNISANDETQIFVYYSENQREDPGYGTISYGDNYIFDDYMGDFISTSGCAASGFGVWRDPNCADPYAFDDNTGTLAECYSNLASPACDADAHYNFTYSNIRLINVSWQYVDGTRESDFWIDIYNYTDSAYVNKFFCDDCGSTQTGNITLDNETGDNIPDWIDTTLNQTAIRLRVDGVYTDFCTAETQIYGLYLYHYLDYTVGIEMDSRNEPAETIFNSLVIEGSNETYYLNLNKSEVIDNVTAVLVLNGTEYSPTYYETSDVYTFERNITLPLLDADVNITMYWDYNVTMGIQIEETNTTLETIELIQSPFSYTNFSIAYELENITYTLEVNVSNNAVATAAFFWNGTEYTPTSNEVDDYYTFTYNLTTPTIDTNITNVTYFWEYNITSDGDTKERNTTLEDQSIYFGVYPLDIIYQSGGLLEGRTYAFNITVFDYNSLNDEITVDYSLWNVTGQATFYDYTGTTSSFTVNITAPLIHVSNYTSEMNINVTFNPTRPYAENISLFGATLTNCSAGSLSQTPFVTFFIREETTEAIIENATSDMTFFMTDYYGGNFTFSFSDVDNNFSICGYPTDENFIVDMSLTYGREGYDTRYYFFDDATISNTTQEITLYLLNESLSTLVTFRVQNENQEPITGAHLGILRENLGEGTYEQVAECLTNNEGECGEHIELNNYYKFAVVKDAVVYELQDTNAVKITSTTQYITVLTGEAGEYWDVIDDVSWSCTTNYTSNYTVCSYVDATGIFQRACLNITRMNWNVTTEVYGSCLTTTSGTISYTYVSPTELYYWDFYIYYTVGGESIVLIHDSGTFSISVTPVYGTWSLFLAAIIVITFSMLGARAGASATLLSTGIGFTLCGIIGLIAISTEWLIGIFMISIVGAYLVNR